MDKFKTPPQGKNESNYAYQARKADAINKHNQAAAKERQQKLKKDGTPDRRSGAGGTSAKNGKNNTAKNPDKARQNRSRGQMGNQNALGGGRKTKVNVSNYKDCPTCGGGGQQQVGVIHTRMVQCRTCGGGGQVWSS